MRSRADGQFAAEIGGHGARPASGESKVVRHAYPLRVRIVPLRVVPFGNQGFDIRRERLQVRLIRRVHAGRGKVFDLAMQQQPERPAMIRLAQIEFQTVRLGESHERENFEIAEIAMRQQIRQHVVAMIVPGASWRTRVAREHYFERRIRRIAGEVFVGIDLDIGRMIDSDQLHLVEINRLFERLHETEAELGCTMLP